MSDQPQYYTDFLEDIEPFPTYHTGAWVRDNDIPSGSFPEPHSALTVDNNDAERWGGVNNHQWEADMRATGHCGGIPDERALQDFPALVANAPQTQWPIQTVTRTQSWAAVVARRPSPTARTTEQRKLRQTGPTSHPTQQRLSQAGPRVGHSHHQHPHLQPSPSTTHTNAPDLQADAFSFQVDHTLSQAGQPDHDAEVTPTYAQVVGGTQPRRSPRLAQPNDRPLGFGTTYHPNPQTPTLQDVFDGHQAKRHRVDSAHPSAPSHIWPDINVANLSIDVTIASLSSNPNFQLGQLPGGNDLGGWAPPPEFGTRSVPRLNTGFLRPPLTPQHRSPATSSVTSFHTGSSRRNRTRDEMTSPSGGQFQCTQCQARFSTRGGLTHHERIHAPKTHRCEQNGCTKTFHTNKDLRRHETTHNTDPAKKFFCPVEKCKHNHQGFNREDHYKRHVKNQHSFTDSAVNFPSTPASQQTHAEGSNASFT